MRNSETEDVRLPIFRDTNPQLVANGYPVDFHKLPLEVWNKWDELPEEAKSAIREKGADFEQYE